MEKILTLMLLVISSFGCTQDHSFSKQDREDMVVAGEIINYIHAIRLMRDDCIARFPKLAPEIIVLVKSNRTLSLESFHS